MLCYFNLVIAWRMQGWLKGQSHILKIAIIVPRKRLSRAMAATFWPRGRRALISLLNFLCIGIMRLWLHLWKYVFMTSLMTSPGARVGQILKLIYLHQYLTYSVDQTLKMSEMQMAIILVYSTSGITSGKRVCRELKMAAILIILKY